MRSVDHWKRAQDLVDMVTDADTEMIVSLGNGGDSPGEFTTQTLAAAQVHATLALAGATALQAYITAEDPHHECEDWQDAAGGPA